MPRIDAASAGGRNALAFLDALPCRDIGLGRVPPGTVI